MDQLKIVEYGRDVDGIEVVRESDETSEAMTKQNMLLPMFGVSSSAVTVLQQQAYTS